MASSPISAEFPYEYNYVTVNNSQMAYITAGEGQPILFLHGNPTSSYLWRNIIPHVSDSGQCIAPDLIGFGASDKPDIDYRLQDHITYLDAFIEKLQLKNITFVVHDWGSGLGFHYARRHPDNVRAIVFMESVVRPLKWSEFGMAQLLFRLFRTPGVGEFINQRLNFFVKGVIPMAISRKLTDKEFQHYQAPFKTYESRKPAMQFPREIPFNGKPEDNHALIADYSAWLQKSEIPKLMFSVKPGSIMRPPIVEWCEANFPNITHIPLGKGLHYVQEDHPHRIGQEISKWLETL